MGADIRALTRDLAAETADLVPILRGLAEKDWARDTPAAGWTIRDQISHLAFFDEAATLSATDPERFRVEAGQLITDGPDAADRVAARFAGLPGEQVLAWFLRAREEFLAVFSTLESSARVPWFGPTMSAAASVTARLMETWAHGQDVADTLAVTLAGPPPGCGTWRIWECGRSGGASRSGACPSRNAQSGSNCSARTANSGRGVRQMRLTGSAAAPRTSACSSRSGGTATSAA